jgi:hypothetical protein
MHSSGTHLNGPDELESDGRNRNVEKRGMFFLFSNFGKRVRTHTIVDSLISALNYGVIQKKPLILCHNNSHLLIRPLVESQSVSFKIKSDGELKIGDILFNFYLIILVSCCTCQYRKFYPPLI